MQRQPGARADLAQLAAKAPLRGTVLNILMVATAVLLLALSYSPLLLSPHRPSPTSRHALLKLCDASAATDESPPAVLIEALGDDRAAEIWERRPPGALPNEKKQAALIDWLQTGPLEADPERYLFPCLRREPKLLLRASSLPALRESHATLGELLREDSGAGQFASAIAHEPALLLAPAEELESAFKTLLDATSLNPEALARILRREPGLLLMRREAVEKRLDWLTSRLQIERGGRMQRVLQRAPLALLASEKVKREAARARALRVCESHLSCLCAFLSRRLWKAASACSSTSAVSPTTSS